jgi:hypothetical protein
MAANTTATADRVPAQASKAAQTVVKIDLRKPCRSPSPDGLWMA